MVQGGQRYENYKLFIYLLNDKYLKDHWLIGKEPVIGMLW